MRVNLKELLTDEVRRGGMWVVAFIGVTVLVALGKIKPETIEYLLFALLGQAAVQRKVPATKEPTND
jgi:hypothetical protein